MVIVVAIVVFIIIMVVAVPMFVSTFRELGTDLPPITKGMIAVSDFLTGYWWVLALLALAFFIGRLLLKRDPKGRMWLAKNKLTRSPLKRLHTMSAASQFASTMATMLTAGLPLVKCLEVTANVIGNDMVAVATRKARRAWSRAGGWPSAWTKVPISRKCSRK